MTFIRDQLRAGITFSFEFFPPKTEQSAQQLMHHVERLTKLSPTFVSVTMGAGGSVQQKTRKTVVNIHENYNLLVMPHLPCIGKTKEEILQEIQFYQQVSIHNILALRGDIPKDADAKVLQERSACRYAVDLVQLLRTHYSPERLCIGVAGYPEGHPETRSKLQDLHYLKAKVDAGADFVITQLFFDNREFLDFRDRCSLIGIHCPIIAGIMPILSRQGIIRMCDLCGARIPAPLLKQLFEASGDDVAKIGTEWAYHQCQELLREGVAGLHFYTLNKSTVTWTIFQWLKQGHP